MRFSYTLIGVSVVALFAIFYCSLGWFGNFGILDSNWQVYCETPQISSYVLQPACFWSDTSFIAVGLWILAYLDSVGPKAKGLISGANPISVSFGFVVLWMGPGSMLEHGSLNNTWGWFDAASIHWFALLALGVIVASWLWPAAEVTRNQKRFGFALALVVGAVGATTIKWEHMQHGWTVILLSAFPVIVIIDYLVWASRNHRFEGRWIDRAALWVLLALVSFGIAMICWVGGHQGNFLCPPGHGDEHLFQPHALFHCLAASAIFFTWMYLVRRESIASDDAPLDPP